MRNAGIFDVESWIQTVEIEIRIKQLSRWVLISVVMLRGDLQACAVL
jgi:hypothetical protein